MPFFLTQLLAQNMPVDINLGDKAVEQDIPYATLDWSTNASGNFGELISRLLMIVLVLGTVAVLGYLLWGAIDWLTSGGDKGKTEKARDKITQAIVGLILIISTAAIMLFVQQLLGICVIDFTGAGCKTPSTVSCSGICARDNAACRQMSGYPAGSGGCSNNQVCCLQ